MNFSKRALSVVSKIASACLTLWLLYLQLFEAATLTGCVCLYLVVMGAMLKYEQTDFNRKY